MHERKNVHVDKVDTVHTVHTEDSMDIGSNCNFFIIASLSHFLPLSSWISPTLLLSLRLISTLFYYYTPYYQNSEMKVGTAK